MWIQESRIDDNGIDKIFSKQGLLDKTPSKYTVISLHSPLPSLNIKEKSQCSQFF